MDGGQTRVEASFEAGAHARDRNQTVAVTPARPYVRAPVLMYHRVASEVTITNDVARDLTVTPVTFRAQMDWLPRTGYTPLSQASSLNPVDHGIRLPAKPGGVHLR